MRRVIQLAGRDVELSADDDRRWDSIDALFGRCPESSAPNRTRPDIRLRFDGRPPELPDRPPDLAYTEIEVWLGGDGAACRSATGVAARRVGNDIHVGGPPDDPPTSSPASETTSETASTPQPAFDLATAFRRSVQHVLVDALAEHGRHALHAASIRSGDVVVVALGDTGAGKSTLAYAASQRGWSVLTDDLTFITTDGGRLLAWGLPKPINIPRDLLGGDEQIGAGRGTKAIPNDARDRVQVPLELDQRDGGHVAAVVLIEHAAGAGHLQQIAPGPSLLMMLLPSFPLAPDRQRMRELFPDAAALSRMPAWTLSHDVDPTRRLDVAGTLLDRITETLALAAVDP